MRFQPHFSSVLKYLLKKKKLRTNLVLTPIWTRIFSIMDTLHFFFFFFFITAYKTCINQNKSCSNYLVITIFYINEFQRNWVCTMLAFKKKKKICWHNHYWKQVIYFFFLQLLDVHWRRFKNFHAKPPLFKQSKCKLYKTLNYITNNSVKRYC